jgi:HK97 gp10 family phage protein
MKVAFKGGRELQAALRELGNVTTQKNVAKRALDKAAIPIRDEAIRLAPDDPKTAEGVSLVSAIKIGERALGRRNRSFRRDNGIVERYIGIDPTVNPRVAFYSEIAEFGKGNNPAKPYMRPAWETKKQVALDRLSDDLKIEIGKASDRASRKAAKL